MTTYAYSFDDESYYGDFPTVGSAIASALDSMEDGQTLYIGKNRKYTAHDFVSGVDILAQIAEKADDTAGGYAAEWPSSLMKNRLKIIELEKLVGDWLQANDPPLFSTIVSARKITSGEIYEAKK